MKIHSIYDNGGKTADRYTVYYGGRCNVHHVQGGIVLRSGRGMSDNPFHPQGFCQYTLGMPGKHNGKRIRFDQMPTDCQKVVLQDLEP